MHIDENKKFDKRNIGKNIKNGTISQKDYEIYLSKLPDVIDKIFNPGNESLVESEEFETKNEGEIQPKKRATKKKITKGKGK